MTETDGPQRGPLALIGGGEWESGAAFNKELLVGAGNEVLVLPTAAAYEHPQRVIEKAAERFTTLGASVRPVMVLGRPDAENEEFAAAIREARFIYLSAGSPLHLRAVLKDSLVLHAIVSAWHSGAVVAGSGAGAMVLSDPMVDPRGGAFTVGFGFVRDVAVVPNYTGEITAQLRRTLSLAPDSCAIAALGERAALIREPDGTWRKSGDGLSTLFLEGEEVDLSMLAGKSV